MVSLSTADMRSWIALRRDLLTSVHTVPSRTFAVKRPPKASAGRDIEEWFHYRRAVVSGVPDTFAKEAIRQKEPLDPIDLEKARRQHAVYVSELRKLVPEVVVMEPDARYPDMVFVEDPAVVLLDRAIINKIGHPTREGESAKMQETLEEMGIETHQLQKVDPRATLDGGDVLFTGREFLVGLSGRTNKVSIRHTACCVCYSNPSGHQYLLHVQFGAEVLSKIFPGWPVTAVQVTEVMHLKSICSMAGVDLVALGDSAAGWRVWREIQEKSQFDYELVAFPDNNAANCLFINGTLLHVTKDEYPQSHSVWEQFEGPRVELANSELAKADGALTCCSVRIN